MQARPVIGIDLLAAGDLGLCQIGARRIEPVTAEVESSPNALGLIIGPVVGRGLKDTVAKTGFRGGHRPGLVTVIDEVVTASLAGVTAVDRAEVIKHIVAKVDHFMGGVIVEAATAKTRVAARMMSDEIMMECGRAPSPDAAITMRTLAMDGMIKALGDITPLNRQILDAIARKTLVDAPAGGAMVDNDIAKPVATAESADGIIFAV